MYILNFDKYLQRGYINFISISINYNLDENGFQICIHRSNPYLLCSISTYSYTSFNNRDNILRNEPLGKFIIL